MSGFSRVSVPPSLRKTIYDIKEITGKHSDEDVYAMLKECDMDPNETAQRLLYLDTFHEVKRKRDRRKVQSFNHRGLEENRRISGMQKRGAKVGNYYSYNSDEGIGGKQLNGHKQNYYSKATRRASKSLATVSHKEQNTLLVASSTAPAEGLTSLREESCSHESTFPLIEDNMGGLTVDTNGGYGNESKKLALRPLVLQKQLSTLYPGPTPTSTLTNPSIVVTKARNQGGSLKRDSSCHGNSVVSPSVSGLHSSEADLVDIIKTEAENQQNTTEISANLLVDTKMDAVQNVSSGQVVSGSVSLTINSLSIERSQESEPEPEPESSPQPCSTSCHIATRTGVALNNNHHSHPPLEGLSEHTISEIEVKLNKLQISEGQSVIFPDHLHVPEALKKALTFGSLDVPAQCNNEDSNPKDVMAPTNVETTKEPSSTHQSPSPLSTGNNCPDRVQSPAQVMENLTASKEYTSSGNALRYDQSKPETLQPLARSHNRLLPSMPDHGPNLVPPVAGSLVVKLDGHEPQISSKVGSTPSMAQSRGITQRSIAVPPPMFPLLRQPYPPNYIPYNPYFPQLYMPPQNAHQLLPHGGFPQQPSPSNIYMPPPAAATSGVKFPIYKPGMHFGMSSCYGSFGAYGLGYGPSGANGNNGIGGPELNDKNMYSTLKQNEDLHVLNSASGRDIPALQPNVFYNLPQGQPVPAFPHAQLGHNSIPGIYHPSQNMSTPSFQSLQQQQPLPQPTGRAVEPLIVVGRRHSHSCCPYPNSSTDAPLGTKKH